jgi:hypothetical protein
MHGYNQDYYAGEKQIVLKSQESLLICFVY